MASRCEELNEPSTRIQVDCSEILPCKVGSNHNYSYTGLTNLQDKLTKTPSEHQKESESSICDENDENEFDTELPRSLEPDLVCQDISSNITGTNNAKLNEYFSCSSDVPYGDVCTSTPISPLEMFRHPFLPTVTLAVPMPYAGLTLQPSAENQRNLRMSARLMRFCAKDTTRGARLKKHRWKSGWKMSLVKGKSRRWPMVLGSVAMVVLIYCCWLGYRYRAVSVRYCDQCTLGEVCIALPNEEVPTCRFQVDPSDITGCGGLCRLGLESCQRLFHDAYRCLDDTLCYENEFKCENLLCIPEMKRCDGHMNCYDRTDEYNCPCNMKTHFRCGNNTSCLPMIKRCNRVIDCWDGADEANCIQACLHNNQFTCADGRCIPRMFFCDGVSDCGDGSDEPFGCDSRCFNSDWTCDNGRCLPKQLLCDDRTDCKDGSDEMHCNRHTN